MITFEHRASGGEIAGAIVQDPEEFGYMLYALADEYSLGSLGSDIAEYFDQSRNADIVAYLRQLADQIEKAAE